MKKFLVIICSTISFWVVASDFYRLDHDPAGNLPGNKIYPHGKIFPIGGFSTPGNLDLSAHGFSLTGPAYVKPEKMAQIVKNSVKKNLSPVWMLQVNYRGKGLSIGTFNLMYKNKERIDWNIMQQSIDQAVQYAIENGKDYFVWWVVTPEELRWWNRDEMEYLKRVCNSIRRQDPLKRLIWMYIPGHYGSNGLKKYTGLLDILMQGYYPRANKIPRVWCRYWSENIMEAAEAAKQMPLVGVVPEMFVEPDKDDYHKIPIWVKHDVYMPLIHGVKAVMIFSLFKRRKFNAHGLYLKAYSEIARQLTTPGGIGEVLLFGKLQNDLQWKIVSGPKEIVYKTKKVTKSYPSLKWRDLKHFSGRYCFVGSSSDEPIRAQLTGLPDKTQISDALNGEILAVGDSCQLDFAPLEIKILKMEAVK